MPAGHAAKKPIMADPQKPKKSCKLCRNSLRISSFFLRSSPWLSESGPCFSAGCDQEAKLLMSCLDD